MHVYNDIFVVLLRTCNVAAEVLIRYMYTHVLTVHYL